jgi:hypothetical protein
MSVEPVARVRCSCDMRPRLVSLVLLAFAAALFWAMPVAAKDGVHATLTTNVPLDTRPETKLTIGWKLAYVEDGKRRAFGASGVFVRLGSASGATAETGYAKEDSGTYTATIAVPEGGIGDVQIGLRGYTSGVRTGRSDLLFPITNDPLPGAAQLSSRPLDEPRSESAASGRRTWVYAVVVASLLAIGVASVVAIRRKPRRHPVAEPGVRPR